MKQKYVRLNENKSNIESVILSFLPTIKRVIKKLEIEENEDLVQECLVNIIEYLNKNANTNLNNIYSVIISTIYKHLLSFSCFSGFKGNCLHNYKNLKGFIDALNIRDEKTISSIFNSSDCDYFLMEQISFLDDYYDERDLDLETKIVNESYVKVLLECLTPRERNIIMLYYGLYDNRCYTVKEIKNIYNVSQLYISQIKKRALEKLAIYNSKMEKNLNASKRSRTL